MNRRIHVLLITSILLCPAVGSVAQEVRTVAGQALASGRADGPGADARMHNPHGIAVSSSGNVYVADRFNHAIRKITPDGEVSTLAGSGNIGSDNGQGSEASFYEPWDVCVDEQENVYVADYKNNLIRKITPDGTVSTLAGSGSFGFAGGPAGVATFGNPGGIALDKAGNLYVSDHNTHIIRKILPDGTVSTLAGAAFDAADSDGLGSAARFNRPYGISMGTDGRLYVADEHNHKIKSISRTGYVTTVAGSGNLGSQDTTALESRFNYPWDVVQDAEGRLYVLDGYNHVIRRIDSTGVTTWVGTSGTTGAKDGTGEQASFNGATGMALEAQSNTLWISDAYNNLIRSVTVGKEPLELQMTVTSDTVCRGEQVSFSILPDTLESYELYRGDTRVAESTVPFFQATVNETGNWFAIALDEQGNPISSEVVSITVNNQPEVNWIPSATSLQVTANDSVSWQWQVNGTTISTADTLDLADTPPGQYTVNVQATGLSGCSTTKDSLISIEEPVIAIPETENPAFYLPDAFSPNNDGSNDRLAILGPAPEIIQAQLVNQWGNQFSLPVSGAQIWDGTLNGQPAEPGTYMLLLRYRENESESVYRTLINLIR
jgi:gliding motility-associated-like protein